VLGVAVLVVAIIALRGPGNHSVQAGSKVPGSAVHTGSGAHSGGAHSSSPATHSSSASHTSSSGSNAPAREPLVVLNNTTITGLAERVSAVLTSGGWDVTQYSNYQNDILSTCAYYDPQVAGAKTAAKALRAQYPEIKRVKPQFTELASWNSPIVLILTADWPSS
jgi:hypothetical protein